jgi:hypothetical protein
LNVFVRKIHLTAIKNGWVALKKKQLFGEETKQPVIYHKITKVCADKSCQTME